MSGYLYGTHGEHGSHKLKEGLIGLAEQLEQQVALYRKAGYEDATKNYQAKANRAREFAGMLDHMSYLKTEDQDGEEGILSKFNGVQSQCGAIFFDDIHVYADQPDVVLKHFKVCEAIASFLGYSRALITHNHKWSWKDLLLENGWKELDSFKNRRSGNTVIFLGKDIAPTE